MHQSKIEAAERARSPATGARTDLNLLRTFLLVAETQSFTSAAKKLGVRRSSVSRSIAALERAYRVQLFSRTTRHVALTTAGSDLHSKITEPMKKLHDTLGAIPERDEEPSGLVRIAAPSDLAVLVLGPILSAFALRHPAIRLDVRLSTRPVDLIAEGFDVALRIARTKLSDSSLVAKRLSDFPIQLYASPSYLARVGSPRTVKEAAASHSWIYFNATRLPPPIPPLKRPMSVTGDDMLFLIHAVRAGLGLGLVPSYIGKHEVASGALVRVLPRLSIKSGTLYFVHPPGEHVPRKVEVLRDFLTEHFRLNPLG